MPLPHYALPNFSIVLPTFSNHETDVITQAFRIGNYVSLSDLPNGVKPGQVNRARYQKVLDNRQPQGDGAQPYKAKPKLFSEFEYKPSPFSLADLLAKEERKAHEHALEKAGHTSAFITSDTRVTLQHEDAFNRGCDSDLLRTKRHFNAFAIDVDPYERSDDQALRHLWLEDARTLAGPFRPAGRVKGSQGEAASERATKHMLPQIVEQVRGAVEEDWGDYELLVCSTDDDHIVVRFELSTLEEEPGLVAYMNVFARSHFVVDKHKLTKVVEDWNVTPGDGHLYFTLRPPWVTVRVTDTFYSIHPEQRVFQDPRVKRLAESSRGAPTGTAGSAGLGASESQLGGTAGLSQPALS